MNASWWLCCLLWPAGVAAAPAQELPVVSGVEGQPLAAQAKRLAEALEFLGEPLPAERRDKLEAACRGAKMDYTDGVKAIWPDRWLQARASNTEPIIRVVAEAPTEGEARELVRLARHAMGES